MDYFLNISRDGFVEVVCYCLGLGVDNNFNSCVKCHLPLQEADFLDNKLEFFGIE